MSWYFAPNRETWFIATEGWMFLYHCKENEIANLSIMSTINPTCCHCEELIPEEVITQYRLLNEGLNK